MTRTTPHGTPLAAAPLVPVWLVRCSAISCFLVAVVLWLGPTLVRDDLFDDDGTHHVFWLYRYADPALFPDDPTVRYFASEIDAPIGYRALYAPIARVVDVLAAAEWLAVLLLASMALFAYLLGCAAARGSRFADVCGLAAAALAMALLSRIDLLPPTAFQRSFAMPLTLMCLWALVSRQYQWIGVSWLLSALIYPVIVPVLGLSAVIVFLVELVHTRRMPSKWIWNTMSGLAAISIVLLGVGTPADMGPTVTFEQALQMPEFGPGGRQMLFGVGWHDRFFLHSRTGIGVPAKVLLAVAVFGTAAAALGRRRWIPVPAIVMGAMGLVLWVIARMTMFTLYLPNRHSRWSVAAAAIVVLAAGAVALLAETVAALHRAGAATWAARAAVVLAVAPAPLVVGWVLYPAASNRWSTPRQQDLERAYAFLETLPKDTLVAAHPDLADSVPLRARRSVLASSEAAVAFHRGYYSAYVPRIEASLDAAYATDWTALDARLAPFGVDVVLSSSSVFSNRSYYPPFDTRVARLTDAVDPSAFVLRDPPADRLLFRSGDVVVVTVRGSGAR